MRLAPASTASCMRSGGETTFQEHALDAHLPEHDGAIENGLLQDRRHEGDGEGDRSLGVLLRLVQVDGLNGEIVGFRYLGDITYKSISISIMSPGYLQTLGRFFCRSFPRPFWNFGFHDKLQPH